MSGSERSLCFIVPPHILREIARRGDEDERARALETLALSERIRGRREAIGPFGALGATPPGEKRRSIYDAGHGYGLPGSLVRAEGSAPVPDRAANEAYDGAGATFDLYREVYDRNSIDGRGMRLDATVHYGRAYDNAFWDGRQMVYGDGDGRLFGRFTAALDVIGHELSHGVIQREADLEYRDQPGALNESWADVMGSLVRQRSLGQTAAEADWLIGRGLFTKRVRGEGLRSLKSPGAAYDDPVLGKDPQPSHMRSYVATELDNGGVHINSGIPNHAFFLAAIAIGGRAWEKAGRIWYVALRDHLRRSAGFSRAAAATLRAARELFGERSREEEAVAKAWTAVGVEAALPQAATLAGGEMVFPAPLPPDLV